MTEKPVVVNKEDIASLRFPSNEVLNEESELKKRFSDLEKALKLGNLEKLKIKIIFDDSEGTKMVETTVWGVTANRIILKQGILVPINRIREVVI